MLQHCQHVHGAHVQVWTSIVSPRQRSREPIVPFITAKRSEAVCERV
jgi:hypothetical protein